MKKCIAIVLMIAMCLSLMTITAFADDDVETGIYGDAEWTLDSEGTLKFTGIGTVGTGFEWDVPESWYEDVVAVEIGEGIDTIAWGAFLGCRNLVQLTIADSVTTIENRAFEGCESLVSVELPSGLSRLLDNVFMDCSSLENVILSESLEVIGHNAFLGCTSLETVSIPNSVNTIESWAFAYCYGLREIRIPSNVVSIGDSVFMNCTALETINIEPGITEIPDFAFENCASMERIIIPDGVTRIGMCSLRGCEALTEIVIPNSVKTIEEYCFKNCANIESIIIPEGVEHLGNRLFENCSALTSLSIPSTLTSLGYDVFYQCNNLNDICVADGCPFFATDSQGVLYNADRTEILNMPANITSITIPETISYVQYGMLSESQIESVYLAEGVLEIGEDAFYGCTNLRSVNIPTTVSRIGEGAFLACDNLSEINIAEGNTSFYTDAQGLVYNTQTNSLIYIPCSAECVCIPAGVSAINSMTCALNTGITEIRIPSSVTYIGDYAFYGCSSLNTIKYEGSTEQWVNVEIGAGNDELFGVECLADIIPITITTQPVSVEAYYGDSAEFSVEATGDGLTYQWQFMTTSSNSWRDNTSTTTGYNTATLTVEATAARNGYKYRCVITDAAENSVITDEVTLTTKSPIVIISQPVDATAEIGATAEFAVVAEGNGLSYQWQYKTTTGSWRDSTSATEGYNSAVLKVIAEEKRNGYSYRCIITDAMNHSVTTDAVTYTVVAAAANETPETNEDPTAKKMLGAKAPAIVITAQPADIEAINGSIAVFTVAAEGEGLTYQWQYNTPSNGSWRNSTSATDGYNTDTLSVQAADGRNGYGYRCVVSDANGNHVTTAEVRLTIKAAIVITAQPADAAAELGDTAVFAVNAEGNGLTYQWQYKTTTGSWKNSSAATDGYNTAVLNVIAEAKRDGYSYRCIITDANGNKVTSAVAVLNVQ